MGRRFRKAKRAVDDSEEESGVQSENSDAPTDSSTGSDGAESENEEDTNPSTKNLKNSSKSSPVVPSGIQNPSTSAASKPNASNNQSTKPSHRNTSNNSVINNNTSLTALASSKGQSTDKQRFQPYVAKQRIKPSTTGSDEGRLAAVQSPTLADLPAEAPVNTFNINAESATKIQAAEAATMSIPSPVNPISPEPSTTKLIKGQLQEDPTMVPNKGQFWGHDNRSDVFESDGGAFDRRSRGGGGRGGARVRPPRRRDFYNNGTRFGKSLSENQVLDPTGPESLKTDDAANMNPLVSDISHINLGSKSSGSDLKDYKSPSVTQNPTQLPDRSKKKNRKPKRVVKSETLVKDAESLVVDYADMGWGSEMTESKKVQSSTNANKAQPKQQQNQQDANIRRTNGNRRGPKANAFAGESKDRNMLPRRQELWTPGEGLNTGEEWHGRNKSEPKWNHDMYDESTQEPQSQREKFNNNNKKHQNKSNNATPVFGSTTITSSGLSVRINKRPPSTDHQSIAREVSTASVSVPSARVDFVVGQSADMKVTGGETITVPVDKETTVKSKRYITRKDRKATDSTDGEELLKKAIHAPEFRPFSKSSSGETFSPNASQSEPEPSSVNKTVGVDLLKSANMSPTSSSNIMQNTMTASTKVVDESPMVGNAAHQSMMSNTLLPSSNDINGSQNIMPPVMTSQPLQPQINHQRPHYGQQHRPVYRTNSYQFSPQFRGYPVPPPVSSASSSPSMTVHPMLTSSGQIVLMTESGLMVASTPDAFGGYDLYSTGGYYPASTGIAAPVNGYYPNYIQSPGEAQPMNMGGMMYYGWSKAKN